MGYLSARVAQIESAALARHVGKPAARPRAVTSFKPSFRDLTSLLAVDPRSRGPGSSPSEAGGTAEAAERIERLENV
jgi:hypothetical protein